jgi:hypothetical protein
MNNLFVPVAIEKVSLKQTVSSWDSISGRDGDIV